MKTVTVKITGKSPLSFSKPVLNKSKIIKNFLLIVRRIRWKENLHYDVNGIIFIPSTMIKSAFIDAIRCFGKQNLKRKLKYFETDILVPESMSLMIHKNSVDIKKDQISFNNGNIRYFPKIEEWSGTVKFLILNEIITRDVFKKCLKDTGDIVGVGRFRPKMNGYYGRFDAEILSWK